MYLLLLCAPVSCCRCMHNHSANQAISVSAVSLSLVVLCFLLQTTQKQPVNICLDHKLALEIKSGDRPFKCPDSSMWACAPSIEYKAKGCSNNRRAKNIQDSVCIMMYSGVTGRHVHMGYSLLPLMSIFRKMACDSTLTTRTVVFEL